MNFSSGGWVKQLLQGLVKNCMNRAMPKWLNGDQIQTHPPTHIGQGNSSGATPDPPPFYTNAPGGWGGFQLTKWLYGSVVRVIWGNLSIMLGEKIIGTTQTFVNNQGAATHAGRGCFCAQHTLQGNAKQLWIHHMSDRWWNFATQCAIRSQHEIWCGWKDGTDALCLKSWNEVVQPACLCHFATPHFYEYLLLWKTFLGDLLSVWKFIVFRKGMKQCLSNMQEKNQQIPKNANKPCLSQLGSSTCLVFNAGVQSAHFLTPNGQTGHWKPYALNKHSTIPRFTINHIFPLCVCINHTYKPKKIPKNTKKSQFNVPNSLVAEKSQDTHRARYGPTCHKPIPSWKTNTCKKECCSMVSTQTMTRF